VTRLVTIATAACLALGAALPAHGGITQRDLTAVDAMPPPGATLPPDLPLVDAKGIAKPLQFWLGTTPSVWVLADYTCETLCGPAISIVSDALARSGLRPGTDFHLVAVGLDPKDTAADAEHMKQALAGPIDKAAYFLRGDTATIDVLTKALGFHSVYDRDRDQFAHPMAAFVLAPGGRLVRALPALALDPASIRLAIVDAGKGAVGTWADHIRLLCYGYDPASGTYAVAIGRILAATAAATILVLLLLIGFLLWHERARASAEASPHRSKVPSRTPTTE